MAGVEICLACGEGVLVGGWMGKGRDFYFQSSRRYDAPSQSRLLRLLWQSKGEDKFPHGGDGGCRPL